MIKYNKKTQDGVQNQPEDDQRNQAQNLQRQTVPNLEFNSFYQGGNMDAIYFQQNEYRMFLRADSNTKGHFNYFNFKIKCNKAGSYRFKILNISKRKSLYERGMKPYIRIINAKNQLQQDWAQSDNCFGVKFGKSSINQHFQQENMNCKFYSLKFQLELKSSYQYQVCYGIPFVYSQLIQMLHNLRQSKNLHVSKLCYSLSGVQIPLLTISENEKNQDQSQQNKETQVPSNNFSNKSNTYYVVITGRIHPAQTNGSHIVNGLIKFLLKQSNQAKFLRKNVVFKIIPMVNPDGVIAGNTRTGFAGKDLNRKFFDKTQFIFPEVINVRDYVLKLKQKYGKQLLFVIDIHGHSTRKGSFFFGPEYPILDQEYMKCRLLPKLYSARSEAFRYYSCKFKIAGYKQSTSRGFFNGNNIRTYTHQTSMYSYYDFKSRKDLAFTKKTLQNLGQELGLAIGDYVERIIRYVPQPVQLPKALKSNKPIQNINKQVFDVQLTKQQQQRQSDKQPSDKADSESQGDDLQQKNLNVFYQRINENRQYFYDELVKYMKNHKDGNSNARLSPKNKQKKTKNDLLQKQKKQAADLQRQKQQMKKYMEKKKQKTNWAAKATYTPKKTLFQEYTKLSNVVLGKNTQYRLTNNLIPKLKTPVNMMNQPSKRYNQQRQYDESLKPYSISKSQSPKKKFMYSVPQIKWDYGTSNIDDALKQYNQSKISEIYKTNSNQFQNQQVDRAATQMFDYGDLSGKDSKKLMKNVLIIQEKQKQSKSLKINKDMLDKLLVPTSSIFDHGLGLKNEKMKNQYKVTKYNLVDHKRKMSILEHQRSHNIVNNRRKSISQSQTLQKDQSPKGDQDNYKNYARQYLHKGSPKQQTKQQYLYTGPQISTKKQQQLCKKWQKQIIQKIRKNNSFSTTYFSTQSKVLQSKKNSNSNKPVLRFKDEVIKINNNSQKYNIEEIERNHNYLEKLPEINLHRKEVVVIRNFNSVQGKKGYGQNYY